MLNGLGLLVRGAGLLFNLKLLKLSLIVSLS